METQIEHYTPTAKWLHWIMAFLIILLLVLGFYLSGLPRSPEKTTLIQIHKAVGTIALALAVWRLVWRLNHPEPPLPASISALQQKATHAVHWALYVLMFAQPLSGWAMSSARGFPVALGGLIPLPPLLAKDEALGKSLTGVHQLIGWALAILVIGHVAMALKHHFVDRDSTLLRMLPRRGETRITPHGAP
jgi:cytochrome b561